MALAVLLLTVPAAFLVFSTDIAAFADLPKRLVIQAGVGVAVALSLLEWQARPARASLEVLGLAGLLASSLWAWATAPDAFFADTIALHWGFCAAAFVVVAGLAREADRETFLRVIAAAGVAVAAIGLGQHFALFALAPEIAPPAATFGNRNWAAQALVPALPCVVFAAWRARGVLERSLLAIGAGIVVAYLAAIVSLAAVVSVLAMATAAGGLCLAQKLRSAEPVGRGRRRPPAAGLRAHATSLGLAVAVALALAALAPAGSASLLLRWQDELTRARVATSEAPSVRSNVGDRLATYRVTLAMIRERPLLGAGLGGFAVDFPKWNREAGGPVATRFEQSLEHVHADPLQLAAEHGLLALLALGCLAFGLVRRALSLAREQAAASASAVAIVALVGLAANGCFSYPLYNAVPPFLAALLLGVAAPFARGPELCARRPGRLASAAVLLMALGFWAGTRVAPWQSEHHMARVHGAVGSGDVAGMHRHAESVLRLGTGRTDALVPLAQALTSEGDYDAALAVLDARLRVRPHDAVAIALRGGVAQRRGQLELAAQDYRLARELAPGEVRLYRVEAALWEAEGDGRAALDVVDAGLVRHPRDAGLQAQRARLVAAATAAGSRAPASTRP